MTKTQYLPADWLDEGCPLPADAPDDFLVVENGRFYLKAREVDEESLTALFTTEITDGSFVAFCEFRDYGHWTLTVSRDADGDIVWQGDADIPADANGFYAEGDTDTFADSIGEMLRCMAESDPDLSGAVSVHACHWSDGKPWYFAVVDDCPHFSPPGTFSDPDAVH